MGVGCGGWERVCLVVMGVALLYARALFVFCMCEAYLLCAFFFFSLLLVVVCVGLGCGVCESV